MRFRRSPKHSDWMGLGEASRILGVAPGTLRRWSDDGSIAAFTTPGGHRRYRRSAIERMLPRDRVGRPPLVRSGMSTNRLARAYRREARQAAAVLPWLGGLTDEQRQWFRTHGRRLAESLVLHLDSQAEEADANLAGATTEAAEYGRMAAGLGVSLSQAVEGFLQFRRPFLHQLGLFAGRRELDAAATTELMEATERAMDRLLLAAMSSYNVARVGERHALERNDEGVQ